MTIDNNFGAVIVTFNRLKKLQIALQSFEQMSLQPNYIVIVNNNSTDGTTEFLSEWGKKESLFKRIIINKTTNDGGSGGFYVGLKKAQELAAEWIWVSDDDAFPEVNVFQIARDFLNNQEKTKNISAICGSVINNGKIDTAHRKTIIQKKGRIEIKPIGSDEYLKPFFELNAFSYVGTIINKEKLLSVGLPNKDFFIWYDDTEHSIRLSRAGKIYCLPLMKVTHDQPLAQSGINWKTYYAYRNYLIMLKNNFSHLIYLRYLIIYYISGLKFSLSSKNKIKSRMIFDAIKSARKNILGMHPVYRPGWKG